jgi:carbonic anhydrase
MGKRLFDSMIEANHRALAGDSQAGLHPSEYQDELPLVALTCVDARLNALLPQALAIPPEEFIWLRNAGNIITGSMSSTMRSLALACAVKGGKEIVVIGHTDCQVGKTTTMQLLDRFRALGIERHMLPDNLNEYFGIFGSDRQNVIKAVDIARSSPLIGPRVPVQGLLIDVATGKLEWLVNGYDVSNTATVASQLVRSADKALEPIMNFKVGDLKFPETKIGELAGTIAEQFAQHLRLPTDTVTSGPQSPSKPAPPVGFKIGDIKVTSTQLGEAASAIGDEIARRIHAASPEATPPNAPTHVPVPPKLPMPLRARPTMHLRKGPK